MRLLLILLATLCLSTACEQNRQETVSPSTTAQLEPGNWPERADSPPLNTDIEARVSAILARMSPEEKVGQIIQPEIKFITPEEVRKYHIGAVLNGGGTTPDNNKHATVQDWVNLAEEFYQASMDESDGKVGIPVLWGSDAVHGNNNLYGATVFPHNIGLGAANDPDLIERIGEITALELAVTGLDWTFGPTVAVVRDDRWGRTYESYSESPEIVREYAKRLIQGIQGEIRQGEFLPGKVIATAKHFLGDGGTTNGVDRGDTAVDEDELMAIHGAGYISALDSNVLTTMASFNSWNGKKLHGHEYLLTDILKERMGFQGFVVGDWNGHRQVAGCTVDRCAKAINAGLDMFMVPEEWQPLYENTLEDVKSGRIPMSRLDDAVRRILRVKFHAGLFDAGPITQREQIKQGELVGSQAHRSVAREAVRKSLVLLKNNQQVLPINPSSKVLVAGSAADNIGQQAGGWTLTWQGTGNKNEDFPGATSIYAGIAEAMAKAGGQAILNGQGEWSAGDFAGGKPDVAIVVIGEEPYAEWHGDIANIEYQYGLKADIELLKKLQADDIPVVTVFVSGRPLWVNKELNASDAFVAAWLPGSEGAGVADVLIANAEGQARHDFQGRLSFSWPKRPTQVTLNQEQENYDPLFAYGYGLSYADHQEVANNLDESSSRSEDDPLSEQWVFVSRANSPWSIELREGGSEATVVDGNSAETENGQVILSSIDKVSQEDARRISWAGTGAVAFTTPVPLSFVDLGEADGVLQFEMKVNRAPENELALAMNCASGCSNLVSLAEFAGTARARQWSKMNVSLACFAEAQASLASVTDVFELSSVGVADVSVANIKVVQKQNDTDVVTLPCTQLASAQASQP
ncbi:MAG: glycoside hydrolase family 3 N-terminal domain-containing protein [Pseudomonadota bacterium]